MKDEYLPSPVTEEGIKALVQHEANKKAFREMFDSLPKVTYGKSEQSDRIAALETALRACAARAGNPNPAEGCRQVIRTAQDALDGKEGES